MKRFAILAIISLVGLPVAFSSESCTIGPCCDGEKLLSRQTLCRPAKNECDEPEYCTGLFSHCPLDITTDEGTPCGSKVSPGQCIDGECWTDEVKENIQLCEDTCSRDNGECSAIGDCVCNIGWKSPPKCDVREFDDKQTVFESVIVDSHVSKRRRRSAGNRHHSAPASRHHKHVRKPVALPQRVEDPPTEDTWTRYSTHPLFIPVVVTIGALVILLVFGIWGTALFRSESNARKFQERIKVERSRRHVPKEVSRIEDPSVHIDVKK